MSDLSREEYIRRQIDLHRIRTQDEPRVPARGQSELPGMERLTPPAPRGQMELPGIVEEDPPPLGPDFRLSPEQMEINRRGMEMVRGILNNPSPVEPEPPVDPKFLHSPEQMEINRRGMEMVRGILSRRKAFTDGQTPAPLTIHHDGEPPCIGC